jgi:hypothetical protein
VDVVAVEASAGIDGWAALHEEELRPPAADLHHLLAASLLPAEGQALRDGAQIFVPWSALPTFSGGSIPRSPRAAPSPRAIPLLTP